MYGNVGARVLCHFFICIYSWLLNSAIEPEDLTPSLTCTMTFAELWDNSTEFSKHHRRADGSVVLSDAVESEVGSGQPRGEHEHTSAGLMLKAIVRRRIEECNERHLWTSGATHVTSDYKSIAPRKVRVPAREFMRGWW